MKLICFGLLISSVLFAVTPAASKLDLSNNPSPTPTDDSARRLQKLSKGGPLIKPGAESTGCFSDGKYLQKEDPGYVACREYQEATQGAFGGSTPQQPNGVMKITPSTFGGANGLKR